MSRSIANVAIATDTFSGLVSKVNQLLFSHTNEILTSSNTATGANTPGNTNILGVLTANVLSTPVIKGGIPGNSSNTSTLTVGFSNSTVTSNVNVVGYTANITSNTVNITSNTNVNTTNLIISATNNSITASDFYLNVGGNTNNRALYVTGNSSYSVFNVQSPNTVVNSSSFSVTSTSTLTGNLVVQSNSSVNALSVSSNSTATTTTIGGDFLNITANLSFTANSFSIAGNVAFDTDTLVINSINDTVGINVLNPAVSLTVKDSSASGPIALFTNSSESVELVVQANATITGIDLLAGAGDSLRLSSNNRNGFVFLASNGNVGINTLTPEAGLEVSGTRFHSNGTVTTSNNLIVSGDTHAAVLHLSNSISISSLSANSLLFTSNTPQTIDTVLLSDYQAIKYSLQVQDNTLTNEVLFTEVSVIYGYGNAHSTQYGTIFSNSQFVDISTTSNSTHIIIQAAPTTAYLTAVGGSANLQFRGTKLASR